MLKDNTVVYKFSRGDYSCHVAIVNGDSVIFSNIKYPDGTSDNVVERMLDEAEREVLKAFNAEKEKGYG